MLKPSISLTKIDRWNQQLDVQNYLRRVLQLVINGDTFLCDYTIRRWKKLESHGTPPTNRAAHGSLTVDHFFFVFGGALGGG